MEKRETEDLLRKIQELDSGHVWLKEEISKLLLSKTLASGNRISCSPLKLGSGGGGEFELNTGFYLNVLQSMGQAVHVLNTDHRLIYWNRTAENLYGYTAAEALGTDVFELLVDSENVNLGVNIVDRVKFGECWTGFFPVNSKTGRKFTIVLTNTPLYDEDGTVIGVTCAAADSKSFEDMRFTLPYAWNSETKTSVSAELGLDPEQPLQDAITSKITDLATKVGNKVRSKMRYGKNIVKCEVSCRDYGSSNDPLFRNNDGFRSNVANIRENATSFFGKISKTGELASKLIKDFGEESEGRASLHKITSKAEAWISKKPINWPWRGNHQGFSEDKSRQSPRPESKGSEFSSYEDSRTPSSSLISASSKSNVSSVSSDTTSSCVMKLDMGTDCLDYEIYSEDLIYKQQIGQGSCGTVYHGFWCGSDVAIKVFPEVEYTDDAILSFRQEVSIMKGLRHPNILLFMGAVLSPQRLCIITEFLPRGSLFSILQRNSNNKLDWRGRINMALDIARGMNYLHRCSPPIVHRDLKSSNFLVDKNWTVKVADFGLSGIKYETYLNTRTGKGTVCHLIFSLMFVHLCKCSLDFHCRV